MSLLRHIAGVPTATEQRCIRCCEVIAAKGKFSFWAGCEIILKHPKPVEGTDIISLFHPSLPREYGPVSNCQSVDLNAKPIEEHLL